MMMRGNSYNQRARGSYGGRGSRPRPYNYRHENNYSNEEREHHNLPTGRYPAEKLENWKQFLESWRFRVTTPRIDGLPGAETLIPQLNTLAEEATATFKEAILGHIEKQQQQTTGHPGSEDQALIMTIVAVMNEIRENSKKMPKTDDADKTTA
jgi:hypothetical protein